MESDTMTSREIDTGNFHRTNRPAAATATAGSLRLRLNAHASFVQPLGAAAMLAAAAPNPAGSTINRALSVLRTERARAAGFTAARSSDETEFVPDPVPQRTSSAAQIVHFQQFYRGVPLFRTAHTVRFAPEGQAADVLGDDVVLSTEVDTAPTLVAEQAVAIAAKHLASVGQRTVKDEFGQEATQEPVKLDGFEPKVIAGFPTLPSQPTVVEWVATSATHAEGSQSPFSKPVSTHLVIFDQPAGPRLGWYGVFTREAEFEQYAVIVSADQTPGQVLYVRDMMHMAQARGNVFEFSPGIAERRMTNFPRPIADFPIMPGVPLAGFPADWVELDKSAGNATVATLNFTVTSLTGVPDGGVVEFNPADRFGDDQKLLNIFYFCNYMHDFLFIVGFDEGAGNFQRVNFTHAGAANDPVRARAHSGPVRGTANMSTAADGTPPVMNMGLVQRSNRHTAFDSDVVFHEFTHGLTNRLVGGTRQGHTLDTPQSQGMGEGWSDFFALTIQNFFRAQNGQDERIIVGDWVVNNQTGIRSNPYDDNYPFTYGNVSTFPRVDPNGNPDPNGLPDEHQTGEIWCAALMMMVRRIRAAVGDVAGYRLGWQMVVDGLKLTPANPSFLDARDAILLALDHMLNQRRIQQAVHSAARQAALAAFGRFGMGPNASSGDAGVDGIVEDVVPPPVA
jgi:extracellular elastinolytic metalloproteinase